MFPRRAGTRIRANAIDSNKHVPMQKFGLILHHNSASTSLPHFVGGPLRAKQALP